MQCQLSSHATQQPITPQNDSRAHASESSANSLHLSGVDEVILDQLPQNLLISVMEFLPLRSVSNLRLVSTSFNEAGKDTIHLKLKQAGIAGQSFDETIKNATAFEKPASAQKKNNQALINRLQNMLDKKISQFTMVDATYLPMGASHPYFKLTSILENSAALDRYKHQFNDRDSRTQLIGLKLANAPLKVKVPARQYREELQRQKDMIPQLGLNANIQASIIKDLDQGIKNMEKHEPHGDRIKLGVHYLPNISPLTQSSETLTQSSETAARPSAYETFMQEAEGSIASKYAVNIPGVAGVKGHQTGIDVSNTSIIFTVTAAQLMVGANASNALIDKQASENRTKIYEL